MDQFRGLGGTVGGMIEGGPNCRYEASRRREMAGLLLTLHQRFSVAGLVLLPRHPAQRHGWRAWVRRFAMWLLAKSGHEVVEPCTHPSVAPTFDKTEVVGLSTSEVRKRFPRFYGECPDCGFSGVLYASYEHMIYGDW